MTGKEIMVKLNRVFRDVFDDNTLRLTEDTTAKDVEGWDSLMHITLIAEVEDAFDIKFSMKEITGMQNVGEMAAIIKRRAK